MTYREIQKPVEDKNTNTSWKDRWVKLKCSVFGHRDVQFACFHKHLVRCVACGEEYDPNTDNNEHWADNLALVVHMDMAKERELDGIVQEECTSAYCPKKQGF